MTGQKLRIFIVTQEDPIYVIRFFEVFFAEYPATEIEICGIAINRPFNETLASTLKRMVCFYGPYDMLRQGLRFVSARLKGKSIRSLAEKAGVRVVATRSVNNAAFIAQVQGLAPDLIVSVAAPEIFCRELLAVPRLGCINIHSGRLPEYRGMMPTFWQMLRREPNVTITVHTMVPKVDAGEVLATRAFPLRRHDNLDRVIAATKREGARLLIEVLAALRKGRLQPLPLDLRRAGYYSFPKFADGRAFRQLGHRML